MILNLMDLYQIKNWIKIRQIQENMEKFIYYQFKKIKESFRNNVKN